MISVQDYVGARIRYLFPPPRRWKRGTLQRFYPGRQEGEFSFDVLFVDANTPQRLKLRDGYYNGSSTGENCPESSWNLILPQEGPPAPAAEMLVPAVVVHVDSGRRELHLVCPRLFHEAAASTPSLPRFAAAYKGDYLRRWREHMRAVIVVGVDGDGIAAAPVAEA